jgi:hypothetical protein
MGPFSLSTEAPARSLTVSTGDTLSQTCLVKPLLPTHPSPQKQTNNQKPTIGHCRL